MTTFFTTIILLFSTFIQFLTSSIIEQISTTRNPTNIPTSPTTSQQQSYQSNSIQSHDITLIGTVGGYLYAVNPITLEKIWSVNIGGPLLSAQEISPSLDYSMVPMIDGSLLYRGNKGFITLPITSCFFFFIISNLNLGVRTTSVTAKTLSENTPFHAQDGLLYNAEKLSKLYEIDLNDGQLLNDFSSSNPIPKKSNSNSVIVGRVDYLIRAYNTQTGQQAVIIIIISTLSIYFYLFSTILLIIYFLLIV